MNQDPTAQTGEPDAAASAGGAGAGAGAAGASEEERARAAYEAELSRISSTDMMLQAAVSLLNIAARRLAPAPGAGAASAEPEGPEGKAGGETPPGEAASGRDLEQVRDAIDAVSALLGILERRIPETLGPLRDALSQLQLAYAREVKAAQDEEARAAAQQPQTGGDSPPGGPGDREKQAGESPPEDEAARRGPGPAEASGRLWVPGR